MRKVEHKKITKKFFESVLSKNVDGLAVEVTSTVKDGKLVPISVYRDGRCEHIGTWQQGSGWWDEEAFRKAALCPKCGVPLCDDGTCVSHSCNAIDPEGKMQQRTFSGAAVMSAEPERFWTVDYEKLVAPEEYDNDFRTFTDEARAERFADEMSGRMYETDKWGNPLHRGTGR